MNFRSVRPASVIPFALVLVLAGCFGEDEATVEFPTFTGKRVIFVADSNGDDTSLFGDEAFVADTGSTTEEVTAVGDAGGGYFDQAGLAGTGGPFMARVVEDPTDGCPSNYRMVPSTGGTVTTMFGNECVFAYASNLAGNKVVIMATIGQTGTNLYVFDPSDTEVIEQINVGNENFPGTVVDMAVSADGNSLFWEDATGVAYADLTATLDQIRFTASLIGPTDHPTGLYPLPNGTGVVYARDDVERYQLVLTNGSEFFITNPLATGDELERNANGARLSANGATLLYAVNIGGVKQLWSLPISTAFAEARADTAATQMLQIGYSFEFSPDGLSYAWTGDDGTGPTVFTAAVNSPTSILTLTPATEEPTGQLHWADGSTVAYISTDADLVTPVGASALRTVNTGTPLMTVAVGPAEADGLVIGAVDVCSDGTLAFAMSTPGATTASALFSADPDIPGGAVQISPTITSTTAEVYQVNCVD